MINVVLDTNVFISGFFWEGNSRTILNLWKEDKILLIISMEIISEIVKVLKDFKIQMPDIQRKELIDLIISKSSIVQPLERINIVKDDPSDNKFIEVAVFGHADYIVSQDKHLLILKKYKNIRIISPEEFLILTQYNY